MPYKDKDGFVARYIGAIYGGSLGKKEVVPMRRVSLLVVAVLALSVLLVVPATAQSWGDHWGGSKWGDHHDDDDKWRDHDDDDKWGDHDGGRHHNWWSKPHCDWFWSWKWGWLRWCWSPWSGWYIAWW